MKAMITIMLALGCVGVASAYDLGNQAPIKPIVIYPENIPNPERQGGDTILNANVIPGLPYYDTGTTAGYADDYSGSCDLAGGAPDVVYTYVPAANLVLAIDLCGSTYDTGLYVFDSSLNEIACNDDFCGLQSRLQSVPLVAGSTYYIIIDGYGTAFGAYQLFIACCPPPCTLDCPAGGFPEGEPPLVEDYVDEYNGGCQATQNGWQQLPGDAAGALTLCGVSGWYLFDGSDYRDTDWYLLTMGRGGSIEVTGDAEYATYLFEIGPQDCASVGIVQQVTVGPCAASTMTIAGYAEGAPVWFWVGPTAYSDPDGGDNEYDYNLWFSGLESSIAGESTTWSTVKALYD
jgi:hypothetical protein